MNKPILICILLVLLTMNSFSVTGQTVFEGSKLYDTLTWFDQQRHRKIPIAIYSDELDIAHKIPVILNHGYGKNRGGDYLTYSYLANALAAKGYFVVSIQHELPTDELMPTTGKPQEVRLPFWERGAQNILFVIGGMKTKFPQLDYGKLALVGHSNGGDTIMLFGQKYSTWADKIISLDNRRMALPRTKKPQIYTIRSSDFPADEGVLPEEAERKALSITVEFSNVPHNNMGDSGSEVEKRYLIGKVLKHLQH